MWSLPIVACDWRGNREILGESFGGICFPPGLDLSSALTEALRQALAQQGTWEEWGKRNRRTFEMKYKKESFPARLTHVLESLV